MSYSILTLETLPAYMRSKAAELPAWFDAGADLEIIELSDGNLNAVYRVTSVTSSLIVTVMTYLVMPNITKGFTDWLAGSSKSSVE